jgi:8-oxo-dGTP diphosphatase
MDERMNDNIITEECSVAFLEKDGKFLLMLRAKNRKLAAGVWCGVGGHIEQRELNHPQAACLREIEEETGITSDHVSDLTLRYLIIRRGGDTLRLNYIYFGRTDAEPTTVTNEGELHWIAKNALADRKFTATFTKMIEHYATHPEENRVMVGVAFGEGECEMIFTPAEDFELSERAEARASTER